MAQIELQRVAHSYLSHPAEPSDFALKRIEHTWESGLAYALLGPSGCGKSTLLNIMSGLLHPSEGKVLIDGQEVTTLPTEKRHIAQVFQFPVVYETMSVFDNLAFPLRNRRRTEPAVRKRVAEIADALELGAVLKAKAHGLSADLKQLISLGRGLVRDDVAAILLDEPLTMIDPHVKWKLRAQLKRLHRRFGHTMIYVTHDQTEALSFADSVAVMCEGEIVQIGTSRQLFERPAHTFVGYFIGSPGMNVLPATVVGNHARVEGCTLELARSYVQAFAGKVEIGVRPEFAYLVAGGVASKNALPATLKRIEDVGRYKIAHMDFRGHELNAVVPEGVPISADSSHIAFDAKHVNVYADGWVVDGEAAR